MLLLWLNPLLVHGPQYGQMFCWTASIKLPVGSVDTGQQAAQEEVLAAQKRLLGACGVCCIHLRCSPVGRGHAVHQAAQVEVLVGPDRDRRVHAVLNSQQGRLQAWPCAQALHQCHIQAERKRLRKGNGLVKGASQGTTCYARHTEN